MKKDADIDGAGRAFARLVGLMRTLRSPEGCPWDREQTLQSLTHFVLEEAYEVVDAIERGDMPALAGEIGDHVFEGVFLAQVADEAGLFTIADALGAVADKLVRRHPHVFQPDGSVHDAASRERAPSPEAALARWNALKAQEQPGPQPGSALGAVPRSLPALLRAFKLGRRAASVGFDWAATSDVIAKIEEEVSELRDTLAANPDDRAHAEEEMGDLLFALANLSRKLDIEPEGALRRASDKFETRFQQMEARLAARGRRLEDAGLDEMESEWKSVKAGE